MSMHSNWSYCLATASETLPEAQRTQGIDSLTWVISPAKYNATYIGSKFGQLYVVPLVLPSGATSIGSNFGQHVMPYPNWPGGSNNLYRVPLKAVPPNTSHGSTGGDPPRSVLGYFGKLGEWMMQQLPLVSRRNMPATQRVIRARDLSWLKIWEGLMYRVSEATKDSKYLNLSGSYALDYFANLMG